MTVFAPPVVPHDDDRGRIPILALPDRVNDASNPRRSRIRVSPRMVRVQRIGDNPRDRRQHTLPHGSEYPLLRNDDLLRPLRTVANRGDRVECVPHRRRRGVGEVQPRNAFGVEQIAQRGVRKARKRARIPQVMAPSRDERRYRSGRGAATPSRRRRKSMTFSPSPTGVPPAMRS